MGGHVKEMYHLPIYSPRYYFPIREKDAFQIPGPVMGNSVYFAKNHEVKR